MAVWYNYKRSSADTCILAFGFLAVAAFDALHTYYFLKLNLTSNSYYDLSTRFWVLGRLVQGITIYMYTSKIKHKANKWIAAAFTIVFIGLVSYITTAHHNILPVLLTEKGVTPIKVVLEYLVIASYLLSLYKLVKRPNHKNIVDYKYIELSLLIAIPAELSFTLYSSVTSITWTIGHFLKIISYYFLYKGVFASTIIYSYERLEDDHRELEEAYRKLEDSNEQLNNMSLALGDILDSLPISVFLYDKDSKIKYINNKFEELFQCNRNEIIGMTTKEFLKLYPRLEEDERYLSDFVLDGDERVVSTIRAYKMHNGEYKRLYISSYKINGGVICLMKDAAEEQEIENLHLQTETILNSINNTVLMIDKNKRIVMCNKALEDLLEMDRHDIIGMELDELNKLINFQGDNKVQMILSGIESKEQIEACLTTASGNKKQILLYGGLIKNIEGDTIGAINIGSDITKLKEDQQRMQQQEKLALLGQLGASIVHETRNYLTTIKGRCQLIELVGKDEKTKDYASKINDDVNEVNRIISEFLFLSKPRTIELEEVSMYDIFHSIESLVTASSLVKGVDIEMRISDDERYLLCDEVQIKQVILNISKNAVEAMSEAGCPKLIVETGYREASNEAFIKITDNGKGICEEDLEKIGTMFYTTKKTGTGLGLNVCNQIIKAHKGKIDIESKLGEGTTFIITIPCIDDAELEDVI
jgi:PAS domain S-box-containing protein